MKDGGFAFPRPLPPGTIATPEALARYGGMTLRQWFAATASHDDLAIIDKDDARRLGFDYSKIVAGARFEYADAMIAAGEAEHATGS